MTPNSSSGFNNNLSLSCTLDTQTPPVVVASSPRAPLCNLSVSTVQVGTQQTVSITIDATTAATTPGTYTFDVTASDQSTSLNRSTTFTVNVRSVGAPLTVISGANTGNTSPATFILPPGASLTSFQCVKITGTGLPPLGLDPSAISVGCSFSPSSVASSSSVQAADVTVTITTGGSTTAGLAGHSDIFAAGLLGLPIFGMLGLLRGRKSPRSAFFRLMAVLAFIAASYQIMGCGGSFQKPTASGGQTPPGAYNLLIQGTDTTNNQVYQAVIQVNVTL